MYYVYQFFNHWIHSKDLNFASKHGVNREFIDDKAKPVFDYIMGHIEKYSQLPSLSAIAGEFGDFKVFEKDNLDSIDKIVNFIKDYYFDSNLCVLLERMVTESQGGSTIDAYLKFKDFSDSLLNSIKLPMDFYSWIKSPEERLAKYLERHGKEGLTGYSTGLKVIDELTGGIQIDDFILISGRTGQGKSLLGDYIGLSVWKHCVEAGITNPILCINTEMTATSVAFRLDTLKGHFPNSALRMGKLPDVAEYESYLQSLSLGGTDYIIAASESLNRDFTPLDVQNMINMYNPVLVIIDQLYDFNDGAGERDIRKKIISVTKSLRNINLRSKVPFIVMAQSGREAAKEAKKDAKATPEIYQIQESDNPAQKATKVMTLRMNGDTMIISLKKNRDGKKDEDVYFKINIEQGLWKEIDECQVNF